MPMKLALGVLVQRGRARFAGEGTTQIDNIEIQEWISEYVGEMYTLVNDLGARYFEAEDTITTTGEPGYALPDAHLSTIGVDLVISGTTGPRRQIRGPLPVQYRSRLIGQSGGGTAIAWALEGPALTLYPPPSSGVTYKHLYAPQPPDLSTAPPSTQVDVITVYGLRTVLWGAASVGLAKGTSSQARALDEYQKARAEVEYWAGKRAAEQSVRRDDDCDWDEILCGAWRYQ